MTNPEISVQYNDMINILHQYIYSVNILNVGLYYGI